MPAVRFHAIPVHDPDTGGPLLAARGAVGNIVDEVTRQPLRLSQDEAGGIPFPQPITITPGGYIPAHWNQDGLKRALFVPLTGTWTTPVWSPQGLEEAAEAAAAGADVAANAATASAESARRLATAAGVGEVNDADTVVASYVGNRDTATGRKLAASYVPAVVMSGTGIDPTGLTNSTAAIQAKFDVGGHLHFPRGSYVIDGISVTRSVTVTFDGDVNLIRKADADAASGSYWAVGSAMFQVDAPGLTVEFIGPFTYDGNAENQTPTEPTGFFLKAHLTDSITSDPTVVRIDGGHFTNGTSGYLLLRGDDYRRRYETLVTLDDCTFTDTIHGIGKGDPGTPNSLGYLPNYVLVLDHVTLVTRDFKATWDKTNGTGQYAACAINGSFYGSDFNTSGECSIFMHGTTYLRGVGRSGKKWDNDADYATNNGIGAIDVYGNGDTLYVEMVIADDTDNVPVRAKGSIKNFIVGSAILTNCHRGLQVSPSTTGTDEAVVKVGSVVSYGGSIPQVEFTGTSTTDKLLAVSIDSMRASGALTNPEALTLEGVLYLRNTRTASVRDVSIEGAPGRAVTVVAVDKATLRGVAIDGAGAEGVFTTGGGSLFELDSFTAKNLGAYAVSLSGNTARNTVSHGRIDNAVNYGVFSNNTTDLTVVDVDGSNITGTPSRAFYAAGGDAAFIHCKVGAGVTTALTTGAGTRRREDHNSWNPAVTWGSEYTTTIGTAQRGDQVWNLSPIAGGPLGWVCITAGSPGVWKTFGGVAA